MFGKICIEAKNSGSPSDWMDGKLSKFQPSVGKSGQYLKRGIEREA